MKTTIVLVLSEGIFDNARMLKVIRSLDAVFYFYAVMIDGQLNSFFDRYGLEAAEPVFASNLSKRKFKYQ